MIYEDISIKEFTFTKSKEEFSHLYIKVHSDSFLNQLGKILQEGIKTSDNLKTNIDQILSIMTNLKEEISLEKDSSKKIKPINLAMK